MKFFSALNDVIRCSGDENGYIPIKYFKEIKNIHTGEQVEFNRHIPTNNTQDKSLSPLEQNFIPVQVTEIMPTSKGKINTLQYIPSIPKHTTDITPLRRAVLKPPNYHEVRLKEENCPRIWTPLLPTESIQNSTYYIPHTTIQRSKANRRQQPRPTTTCLADVSKKG